MAGNDFEIGGLGLTFRNMTENRQIPISLDILQDDLVEGHEIISITLTDPQINGINHPGGAIIDPNGHRRTLIIIEEDDGMCYKLAQCHVDTQLL